MCPPWKAEEFQSLMAGSVKDTGRCTLFLVSELLEVALAAHLQGVFPNQLSSLETLSQTHQSVVPRYSKSNQVDKIIMYVFRTF